VLKQAFLQACRLTCVREHVHHLLESKLRQPRLGNKHLQAANQLQWFKRTINEGQSVCAGMTNKWNDMQLEPTRQGKGSSC
jgi:hypothetical protein